MTVRDLVYCNDMDINARWKVGLYDGEEDDVIKEIDDEHQSELDEFLDNDILYMTIRNDDGTYIYFEININ